MNLKICQNKIIKNCNTLREKGFTFKRIILIGTEYCVLKLNPFMDIGQKFFHIIICMISPSKIDSSCVIMTF